MMGRGNRLGQGHLLFETMLMLMLVLMNGDESGSVKWVLSHRCTCTMEKLIWDNLHRRSRNNWSTMRYHLQKLLFHHRNTFLFDFIFVMSLYNNLVLVLIMI